MRKLSITFILFAFVLNGFSQLPYTWVAGVDPGWISAGGDGSRDITWRAGCAVVTTNCNGKYNNNEFSTYTSNTINANCFDASTVNLTFTLSGNAEWGYDFLFMEYSLDNGATWVNPLGIGVGWTGNAGGGFTIPPVAVPKSATFKYRFTFTSDWIFNYSGYKISDFDIACNVILPIQLISFEGTNENSYNLLKWSTASEINNDYFTLERSTDGTVWEEIATKEGAHNSSNQIAYDYNDFSFISNAINYYRLKQTDFDGNYEYFDIVAVDNKDSGDRKVLKVVNFLGQEIDANSQGLRIIIYDDGSTEKKSGK